MNDYVYQNYYLLFVRNVEVMMSKLLEIDYCVHGVDINGGYMNGNIIGETNRIVFRWAILFPLLWLLITVILVWLNYNVWKIFVW